MKIASLTATILSVAIFSSAITPVTASAASVNWHTYSPHVFKSARNADLPVFIFAILQGCQWCNKMKSTVFSSPSIAKFINDNYYPVMLDIDRDVEAANQYNIASVPTFIFFDKRGNVTQTYHGYKTAGEMKRYLADQIQNESRFSSYHPFPQSEKG